MPKRTDNSGRLLRVADDPKVKELETELAERQARLPALQERHALAQAALESAQTNHDRAERAVLAGRASDQDLAVAQQALLEAKRTEAIAGHDLADVQHVVDLLPEAIELAKQSARARVAATLRADYAEALAAFQAALLAARDASERVYALHQQARDAFPPSWGLDNEHLRDAGDAGIIPIAAGLPNLAWSQLTRAFDVHNNTVLENWLKEASAVLAAIPGMPEADRAAKASRVTTERQATEENRIKLAHLAEVERRNLAKYGIH